MGHLVDAGPAEAGDPRLSDLAETDVLDRIFPRLPAAGAALVGPGDDAAVVMAPDGRFVVTTDLMVHGPDFRLAWSTPFELGWKAAATNLSDVAAMGARPTALVVAIAAPGSLAVSVLEGIADGLREGCARLAPGCGVVGGDLSVSATLTIAVTAFGDLEGRRPVLRSGARPGDVIAHAGRRGAAARGLRLLFSEAVNEHGEPDAVKANALRERHAESIAAQFTPEPPIAAGVAGALAGATAMLDVSDGLARDAERIAKASHVVLDFDPVMLGDDPYAALSGAEDHGLLATFPPGTAVPAPFEPLGVVRSATIGSPLILVAGEPIDVAGWDPYSGWDGAGG